MIGLVRRRGVMAKRRGGTAYSFPSNLPLTPTGTNTDPGQSGGLVLATVVQSTRAGVVATGIRFWMPTEGVGQTLTGFLFAGVTGSTVLAQSIDATAVAGWNVLPFTTPYPMTSSVSVSAAIYLRPAAGDGLGNVTYSALASALTSARVLSPLQTIATGSRYNYGAPALTGGSDTGSSSAWYGVDVMVTG